MLVVMDERYLFQIKTGWEFRRRMPKGLGKAVGKSIFKKKLGGLDMDPVQAVRLCRAYGKEVEREISLARGSMVGKTPKEDLAEIKRQAKRDAVEMRRDGQDEVFTDVIPDIIEARYMKAGRAAGRSRSDLLEAMHQDPDVALAPFRTSYERELWNELVEDDRYRPDDLRLSVVLERANQIRPVKDKRARPIAVKQFIEELGDRPVTEIKWKDVDYFIARLRESGQRSDKTIDKRLSSLSRIVQIAFDVNDINQKNPFRGHYLVFEQQRDKRAPFNTDHLNLIRNELVTNKRMQWKTKAMLKMLINTPCMPSEVGGLMRRDIVVTGDVPHVWIRENEFRGLKTGYRERHIPLIGLALEGATEALEKAEGDGPVFGLTGCNTNSLSARLTLAIRRAGIPKTTRLVPYCFRHTFKAAMNSAGIPRDTLRKLMGYSAEGVEDNYGASQVELNELKVAVVKSLEFLGHIDDSVYLPGELVAVRSQ